jgi:multiple sugar transport system substrate-binding protein
VTVQILDRNPGDALIPDYDRVFQRFTQAHPSITVERLDTGGQDRDKKFQVLAAGGQPADVDWMDQSNIGPFREQGLLRPLDTYLKRDRYALEDFYPAAQKIYQFRGQTFGLLHTTSPRIYVYNTSLFQKKGVPLPTEDWTWNELKEALTRLTGGAGEDATFGGAMGRDLEVAGFVYQNGGKVVDDLYAPTRALLDTREALEGVQYLVDLDVKLGLSAGDPKRSGGLTAAQLWTAGRLGIYHTSIWSHKVWARDLQFEWDQVVPARNKARASMLSSSGHIIAQQSRNPDEAWELVKELNSKETMSALAATGGLMLGRKSVSAADAFLRAVPRPANMKAFAQAMDYAYPTRVCNGLSVDFYDLTVKQMAPVWAGTQSVPSAMTEVVRQANAMFAEYAARTGK